MAKIFPEPNKSEFSDLLEQTGLTCKEASENFGIAPRTIYRWNKGELQSSTGYTLAVKQLKEMVRNANPVESNKPESSFTYIDLFAGIGGFRKAFDLIGGECVFTSEWDKQCRITYQANYICDHDIVGDIREYTKDKQSLDRIPKHDLLVAGFPCQPFSIAGVSKKNSLGRAHGFMCDTQGTLFFDLAQIIEHHKPSMILLENVKNLTSHDGGKTFKLIKGTLEDELGYNISCRVIDGKSWVPQHRERIFIVGIRKDIDLKLDLHSLIVPTYEDGPKLGSILHKKTEEDEVPYFVHGQVSDKYTLTQNLWDYLQRYKEKHAAKGNGFGFSVFGKNDVTRTLSARYYKDGSEILVHQDGKRPRRLTPRECARLMGFDGPNESNFKIMVSDTQAYRQFGNSVIVPCAKAIAEFIKPYILDASKKNRMQLTLPFNDEKKKLKTA
jgi:DNA (cytosine-5)-methyltransferase 1